MDSIVAEALEHIRQQYPPRRKFNNAPDVGNYFCLRLGMHEREVFSVAFLDSQLGLIGVQDMFFGSVAAAFVSPREIVKQALKDNASAVVLAHNHPSGCTKPSDEDLKLTIDLRAALQLIDVRVVDHIVVGGAEYLSFSEQGLLNAKKET
jgi:DNA repair protein RadC